MIGVYLVHPQKKNVWDKERKSYKKNYKNSKKGKNKQNN